MKGLAENLILKPGTVLLHGTLADKFVHKDSIGGPAPSHYIHPPTPDGPAWFAIDIKFSLHAAVRFTNPGQRAEISLYKYTVRNPISMMEFDDMDSFAVYLKEQHQQAAHFNGVIEAAVVAKRGMNAGGHGLEGFALKQDVVRGEPEYVLFDTGMARLSKPEITSVTVMPVDGKSSLLVDAKGKQLGTYHYTGGVGQLDWKA